MIDISLVSDPSAHIKARAALMWARRSKESTDTVLVYRVIPHGKEFDHKNKDKRRVEIELINQTAECISLDDGTECKANSEFVPGTDDYKRPRMCSHVWTSLLAMRKAERARETKKEAA